MHNERAWPQFSIVLLCTLKVMYLQCTLKFMNCFHVKTSLTYWVLPYSNESNIHCCFCIWAKGIRTIEKQSSRPLNVPMVEHWALSIEHCTRNKISISITNWFIPCPRPCAPAPLLWAIPYLDQSKLIAYDERACLFNELLLINHNKRIFPIF